MAFREFDRITLDPAVMGGKATIRNTRVTVSNILTMLSDGHSEKQVLESFPYLEPEDIRQALGYAAWRVKEIDVPFKTA